MIGHKSDSSERMLNVEDVTKENLIQALNDVIYYKCYEDIVSKLIEYLKSSEEDNFIVSPIFYQPYKGETEEERVACEFIWCICVSIFGDYGVSLRGGWVNNKDSVIKFLEKLIEHPWDDEETERENE